MKSPIHRSKAATRDGPTLAAAAASAPRHERTLRRRLGEVLVGRGVLTDELLDELLAEQAASRPPLGSPRRRLGQMVIDAELATESEVAEALADLLALDVIDLSSEPVDPASARLIPGQWRNGSSSSCCLKAIAACASQLRIPPTCSPWTMSASTPANVR